MIFPSTVHFSGVTIVKNEAGLIGTDLHIKPTDPHQFLLWSTCHHVHIRQIILSEGEEKMSMALIMTTLISSCKSKFQTDHIVNIASSIPDSP